MARRRSVQDLHAEVIRLRGERRSFSQVASELGISKAYAVKLGQRPAPVTDRSPTSVTSDRSHGRCSDRSPKARQRRFAKALAEGKACRQAAMDAALPAKLSNSGADSYANRTLKDARFRETFEQMLERKGLSEERIAEIHAQNLEATKVVATATKEGQITDILERPDYATRQRAVQASWRIHGRDRPEDTGEGRPVILMLSRETKAKAERAWGTPIDCIVVSPDEDEQPEPKRIEAGEAVPVDSEEPVAEVVGG